MSLVVAMLAPLALLLPAANGVEPVGDVTQAPLAEPHSADAAPNRLALPAESGLPAFDAAESDVFETLATAFRAQTQDQVRIEQRVTIRITPRQAPVQPSMLMDAPASMPAPRRAERDIGQCLPIAGIGGVQAGANNRLTLFMRDRRVVRGELERACTARDFYSGFYVERNSDGQLCVKRDTLRSRSGAACKLSKLKQLVDEGD